MDGILTFFRVLFTAASRSALGKTDLFKCMYGFFVSVCFFLAMTIFAHNYCIDRGGSYDPEVPKVAPLPPWRVKRWQVALLLHG